MKNFVFNNGRFFDVGDSITECHECKFCSSHSENVINCDLPPTDLCGPLAKRLRDFPSESIEEQKAKYEDAGMEIMATVPEKESEENNG